jgi:hypothetical protein
LTRFRYKTFIALTNDYLLLLYEFVYSLDSVQLSISGGLLHC